MSGAPAVGLVLCNERAGCYVLLYWILAPGVSAEGRQSPEDRRPRWVAMPFLMHFSALLQLV
jgi:hypothetical protein